jgi:NAD(P)-dependent dehydrogenase (short-subunit alcohol dehydrogenase family)
VRVDYNFAGSVVLVTGGASGIGAAVAHACEELGAKVVVADVNGTPAVDVSDPHAVKALVASVVEKHGRIDAAVLAAAIQKRTPIESMSDEEWRRHMAVNLDGVFHCLRELAPVMKKQRRGSILLFTSGLVNMGWPGTAAYTASKGAMIGLAKCAALELREHGVRVNVLSPGLIATPMFLGVASAEEYRMYENSVGVSRPEAVVPTVLHLISDASASMTGAVIERRLFPTWSQSERSPPGTKT